MEETETKKVLLEYVYSRHGTCGFINHLLYLAKLLFFHYSLEQPDPNIEYISHLALD